MKDCHSKKGPRGFSSRHKNQGTEKIRLLEAGLPTFAARLISLRRMETPGAESAPSRRHD